MAHPLALVFAYVHHAAVESRRPVSKHCPRVVRKMVLHAAVLARAGLGSTPRAVAPRHRPGWCLLLTALRPCQSPPPAAGRCQ